MQRHKPRPPLTDANTVPAVPTAQCEVLTVAEAAALLKVPPSSIYEWTRYRGNNRGASLPHRKVGKYIRVLKHELMNWLLAMPKATNTRKRKYVRKVAA
jgi:excisionase family DNA binding protein